MKPVRESQRRTVMQVLLWGNTWIELLLARQRPGHGENSRTLGLLRATLAQADPEGAAAGGLLGPLLDLGRRSVQGSLGRLLATARRTAARRRVTLMLGLAPPVAGMALLITVGPD
jgi:hypothetical protein